MIPLRIVPDDWAQPAPEPGPFVITPAEPFNLRLMLDAMLSASITRPGPLILVTGI